MINKTVNIKSFLGICSVAIALNTVAGSLIPINARPANQKNNQESVASINNGLPSYRRDGGTRSGCAMNSHDFVALVPDRAVNLTASTNPKLYFHVPETDRTQNIEFVLRDRQDRLVYETLIQTKGEAGIMSVEIPFPLAQQSLKSGTGYRWYLSNICNPQKRSQDIVLEGWIEHRALSQETQQKIATLSPAEQANFYQQQDLWYDALAIASIEAQTKQGNISQTQWSEFLNTIGLEQFAERPLID